MNTNILIQIISSFFSSAKLQVMKLGIFEEKSLVSWYYPFFLTIALLCLFGQFEEQQRLVGEDAIAKFIIKKKTLTSANSDCVDYSTSSLRKFKYPKREYQLENTYFRNNNQSLSCLYAYIYFYESLSLKQNLKKYTFKPIECKPKSTIYQRERLIVQNKVDTTNNPNFSIPSIMLNNIDGVKTNLKSLVRSDKNYIILFWATWMKSSIEVLEKWKPYYPDWKNNLNIEVIAISFDVERQIPNIKERIISRNNWTYPIFFVEDSQKAQESIYNNNYLTKEEMSRSSAPGGQIGIPLVYVCLNGEIIKQFRGHGIIDDSIAFNEELIKLLQE